MIIVIASALSLMLVTKVFAGEGNFVSVSVDGTEVERFSLSENVQYEIEGIDGGTNLLVIKDGFAYVEKADCPDGLCMKQGRISKAGETIVCLPHRVIIKILGNDDKAIDIMVN